MRSLCLVLIVAAVVACVCQAGAMADVTSLVKQLASPNIVRQWGAEVELWSCGPESTPVVTRMLKDKDPTIRAAAAEAMWHIRDRKAIPSLKLALKDPDAKVRTKVKDVLNRFDPPQPTRPSGRRSGLPKPQPQNQSFDELAKRLTSQDRETRRYAIYAIGNRKDPRLFTVAARLIRDKDQQVASGALAILLRFRDGRSDKVLLESWKLSDDPYSRRWQDILPGYPGAAKLGLVMIKDPNESKREQAAELLCSLEDPACIDALREAASDSSAEVRRSAVMGLSRLGTGSIPLIIQALGDPSEEVSTTAAMCLGKLKAREAVDPLLALFSDKDCDEYTKSNAAASLGQIGDPKAIPALIDCLKRRSEFVKASAAGALGMLKATQTTDMLCGLLKDSDSRVRADAAAGLGLMGDPKAGDALVAMGDDPDENTFEARLVSLARLKDPRAFDILAGIAGEYKSQWKMSAVRALGVLGDPRGCEYVLPYLADPVDHHASTVTTALAKIQDPRAVKPLIAAIERG